MSAHVGLRQVTVAIGFLSKKGLYQEAQIP